MPNQKVVTMVAMAVCGALVGTATCRRDEPAADRHSAEPSASSTADVGSTSPPSSPADATLLKPADPASPSQQRTNRPEAVAEKPVYRPEKKRMIIPIKPRSRDKPLLVTSEEVDDAEAEMIMRWDEFRSFSAKCTMEFERKKGLQLWREGAGLYDCRKTQGKLQTRLETAVNITAEQPEGSRDSRLFTVELMLNVSDGEITYVVRRFRQGAETVTTYTRQLADPSKSQLLGGRLLFNRLRTLESLELLPGEETIDGRPVYVFVGTGASGLIRTRHHIDKATGILLKRVIENDLNETTEVTSFSEIQIDPELEPDYFKYTPPEGAEVRDLVSKQSRRVVPIPMPPGE